MNRLAWTAYIGLHVSRVEARMFSTFWPCDGELMSWNALELHNIWTQEGLLVHLPKLKRYRKTIWCLYSFRFFTLCSEGSNSWALMSVKFSILFCWSQWPRGIRYVMSYWDCEFESHARRGWMPPDFLCCVVLFGWSLAVV